ncbi:uncharacterized protein LOC100182326 [Ciona intestinalis]
MSAIPVLDFEKCGVDFTPTRNDLENVGNLLFDALSTVGFVYLKNTGISRQHVDEVNIITNKFFIASIEEKNKYERNNELNYGYSGLCVEKVNPNRPADYKEAFDVSGKAFLDGATEYKWPNPVLFPEFEEILKKFADRCKTLTLRILRTLSVGMKLKDESYFERAHSHLNEEGNLTTIRSLYYRPLPPTLPPGQVRLGEHSDYGSVTLLFQDNVGGLEVENQYGEYMAATPIDETVIVNIGDILEFWTEGKLKSTKHRVMIPDEAEKRNISRRSLVYFVRPDNDVIINDRLTYQGEEVAAFEKSQPITSLQYTKQKFDTSFNY